MSTFKFRLFDKIRSDFTNETFQGQTFTWINNFLTANGNRYQYSPYKYKNYEMEILGSSLINTELLK